MQTWVVSSQPFLLWHWAMCSQSPPVGLLWQPTVHLWRHTIYATHHKWLSNQQVWRRSDNSTHRFRFSQRVVTPSSLHAYAEEERGSSWTTATVRHLYEITHITASFTRFLKSFFLLDYYCTLCFRDFLALLCYIIWYSACLLIYLGIIHLLTVSTCVTMDSATVLAVFIARLWLLAKD